MKKIIIIFLLLLLLAAAIFQGIRVVRADTSDTSPEITPVLDEENLEKAYENVLCSAVRIQANGYYGSGSIFLITEDTLILATNRHVIQYFDDNSSIAFFNGEECGGRALYISETADVGFIGVSKDEIADYTLAQLRSVSKRTEAFDALQKNDCFFMIDLVTDPAAPVVYKGAVVDKEKYLSDYGMEMLYGDGMAVPGMSGSGIFDYYGNFIGMLSGATEQYEIAGISLPVLLEEYEKSIGE